ncbi:hypothetical protein A1OE_545 [Candidatus Endolissoclinum faulkneri L2]|uniref:Uncharacterized protein n=1 Tax=Candidatus Endolissoclinum faulkneri L2 TaxID=1193729 RepID=K7Z403_9PROT|nr:hypothetical protein A1OE_545 [Candidatus Endolissoclinum faulkneri L2]
MFNKNIILFNFNAAQQVLLPNNILQEKYWEFNLECRIR